MESPFFVDKCIHNLSFSIGYYVFSLTAIGRDWSSIQLYNK